MLRYILTTQRNYLRYLHDSELPKSGSGSQEEVAKPTHGYRYVTFSVHKVIAVLD